LAAVSYGKWQQKGIDFDPPEYDGMWGYIDKKGHEVWEPSRMEISLTKPEAK
jgi:hypothetical protein